MNELNHYKNCKINNFKIWVIKNSKDYSMNIYWENPKASSN